MRRYGSWRGKESDDEVAMLDSGVLGKAGEGVLARGYYVFGRLERVVCVAVELVQWRYLSGV
jgi:hypothetical protein